jgi:hypothetical protein
MILDDQCLRDYFHDAEIPETPFQPLGSRVSWRLLARVSQPFCIERGDILVPRRHVSGTRDPFGLWQAPYVRAPRTARH